MVSDRTTDRLFLYHGGVPGLGPGDLIEPGHPRGPYRRKFEALGPLREIDPPARNADLVYLTPSRIYAAGFAHAYPHGDLYRVEPVGPLACGQRGALIVCAAPGAVVTSVLSRGHRKPGTEAGDMGDRQVTTAERPVQGA